MPPPTLRLDGPAAVRTPSVGHAPEAVAPRLSGTPAARRKALLLAACFGAAVAAGAIGEPEARAALDADLARLLRGMALVKALLVLAVIAVLLWRFSQPVSARMGAIYLMGSASMAASSALIWQLSSIPLAAIGFHAGVIALLVAAWRDDAGPWHRAEWPRDARRRGTKRQGNR